jgi:hypothetical protein
MKDLKSMTIKLDEDSIDKIKMEFDKQLKQIDILTKQKHYLGDAKWVLYQTICDMNYDTFTFVCGTYAMSKIANMQGFKENKDVGMGQGQGHAGYLDLNGENIKVYCLRSDNLDKKEIFIVKNYINDRELCSGGFEVAESLYFA